MAKKDSKKKKDKKGSGAADTVEAVRTAVERALPEGSKERGREIVDEVARAVTRVRESLEERGVLEELKGLRTEIENLARRVGALERPGAKPASGTTAATPVASRARSTGSRSTAAKKPAARRSTAAKSTAAKARSTAAKKPAAAKASTARKPAAKSTSSRSTGTRTRSRAPRSSGSSS
jgi:hypothetical protein